MLQYSLCSALLDHPIRVNFDFFTQHTEPVNCHHFICITSPACTLNGIGVHRENEWTSPYHLIALPPGVHFTLYTQFHHRNEHQFELINDIQSRKNGKSHCSQIHDRWTYFCVTTDYAGVTHFLHQTLEKLIKPENKNEKVKYAISCCRKQPQTTWCDS